MFVGFVNLIKTEKILNKVQTLVSGSNPTFYNDKNSKFEKFN